MSYDPVSIRKFSNSGKAKIRSKSVEPLGCHRKITYAES